MYHQHFGLREPPFSIAVNPRYLFMSPRHRDALAHLLYGVSSGGGFILLTGEVGTGKTTVNRCLLEQLPATTDVAIILNPALDALELLASVCDELGVEYPEGSQSLKALTDALHRFLLDNHAAGRRTVLMIDEAQHLDFDVLEQIRLLTNLETHNDKLLQILLIGQPELTDKLARPELRQLNQRITARYHLEPLNREETVAYIRHRLEVAGNTQRQPLFPEAVVNDIHRRSRGIPRLINLLCDRALLGAYGQRRSSVDRGLLRRAAQEVLGEASHQGSKGLRPLGLLGIAGLVLALGVAWLAVDPLRGWVAPTDSAPEASAAVAAPRVSAPAASVSVAAEIPTWLLPTAEAEVLLWQLASDALKPDWRCPGAVSDSIACETLAAMTWEPLVALDRPVLLSLRRPDRFAAAAILLGIRDRMAQLYDGTAVVEVPLAALADLWTGDAQYLWRTPSRWATPLAEGDQGPAVASVAILFARLDGQPTPLTADRFTEALTRRVRLFQEAQGLTADGVVGVQTLLSLNRALGIDLSRQRALQRTVALEGSR